MRLLMVDEGNDVRSQMAEGWARALSAPGTETRSAGSAPTRLRPEVIAVMREVGIDLGSHHAKPLGGSARPDAVIDVGTDPSRVSMGQGVRRVRWAIPDPTLSEEGGLGPFRVARDAIGARVSEWLAAQQCRASFGTAVRDRFVLPPDIAFLNHGSFGATPRSVLEAQRALQDELEAQPVRFMLGAPDRLRRAAASVAAFLKANPDGLVFVENATSGVNTVLRSMDWSAGDVIVTTTHRYNAVGTTLQYLADRYGVVVHAIDVPFPLSGPGEVVQALRDQWPERRVRLALFDHVPSITATVWPVEAMIELAREKGAEVLIDGAHVPGQVPVDLTKLKADYWVGNCHKWLFAPKGCAVLYVGRHKREALHPLVISHGYRHGLAAEFDWVGTRDPSAWLAVEAAIGFVQEMGGPDRIRAHNVALRQQAAHMLEARLGLEPCAPAALFASMETRLLPESVGGDPDGLSARIWSEHRVESMIAPFQGRLWLRISAQIYNAIGDYERLATALEPLVAGPD